jgi:hypothetical protein
MKTSVNIPPEVWEATKRAARAWAERQGIPGDRVTSLWVARALRRAADEEIASEQPATG